MKYQLTEYTCGPAAVQNALRALGKRVGQGALVKLCGTTTEGTDEEGIKRALLHHGCAIDEFVEPLDFWKPNVWLEESIFAGRPVILCVDSWDHWVTVVGRLGASRKDINCRYIVIDSARWGHNLSENGVKVYKENDLLRRWKAGHSKCRKEYPYYGIAVTLDS